MTDLQNALDWVDKGTLGHPHIDTLAKYARLVANPNIQAALAATPIGNRRYVDQIVAAALTPQGDTEWGTSESPEYDPHGRLAPPHTPLTPGGTE